MIAKQGFSVVTCGFAVNCRVEVLVLEFDFCFSSSSLYLFLFAAGVGRSPPFFFCSSLYPCAHCRSVPSYGGVIALSSPEWRSPDPTRRLGYTSGHTLGYTFGCALTCRFRLPMSLLHSRRPFSFRAHPLSAPILRTGHALIGSHLRSRGCNPSLILSSPTHFRLSTFKSSPPLRP